jgi:opacity protein-like surface antigen
VRPPPIVVAAALAAIACPGVALAAPPRTGDLAFTVGFGLGAPVSDGDYGGGGLAAGSQEIHWSSANSLRGSLGFLDLPAEPDSGRGERSAIYLAGNVSHNWWRGAVFPYVTGGVGIYAIEERTGPRTDDDKVELGVNGGAGLEFRVHTAVTLRLEGMIHALTGDGPQTIATGTLGLKFYY